MVPNFCVMGACDGGCDRGSFDAYGVPHYAIEETALLGRIWALGFSSSYRMVLPKDSLLLSLLRASHLAKVVVLEEWEKVLHESPA